MNQSLKGRIARARGLRRTTTLWETMLWAQLRGRRFLGLKFRRQVPIGPYIVDFLCYEKRLVVEVDGGQHSRNEAVGADNVRTDYLKNHGYAVVRFWNNDIDENLDGVLVRLRMFLVPPLPLGEDG